MSDEHTEPGMAAKHWAERNSDFRATFEGERIHQPPVFELTECPLPETNGRIPETGEYQAHAIRHTHIYDPELEPQ